MGVFCSEGQEESSLRSKPVSIFSYSMVKDLKLTLEEEYLQDKHRSEIGLAIIREKSPLYVKAF